MFRPLLTAVLGAALVLTACDSAPKPPGTIEGYFGVGMDPPPDKLIFTLTDMHGEAFSFGEKTEGYLTLLFFGYTYCPDICPVHMASIAAVMRDMDPDKAEQIKVVFVSVDPERDTPERMREWLGAFDERFIGLRGDTADVNVILRTMAIMPTGDPVEMPDSTGDYAVAHWGAVIAYTKDNRAHLMYPFGIQKEHWAHDLPLLVDEEWGG